MIDILIQTKDIKIENLQREDLLSLKIGDAVTVESLDQYTGGKYLDIPAKLDELLNTNLSSVWGDFKNVVFVGTKAPDMHFQIPQTNCKYFHIIRTESPIIE